MDTLNMLRSYAWKPEPIPLHVEYGIPKTRAIDDLIDREIAITNQVIGPLVGDRFLLYRSMEHGLLDVLTLYIVQTLGQARPGEVYQGMDCGNGVIKMIPDAAPWTLVHEIGAHVILGHGHHMDAERADCIKSRAVGPKRFCREHERKIGETLLLRL